jgi:hypothetical protein
MIVICDNCDKGFHTNCHEPAVDLSLVEGVDWFCSECQLLPKDNNETLTVEALLQSQIPPLIDQTKQVERMSSK